MGKAQMRLLIIAFTAGMSTGADAETGGSNHLVAVLPLTAPKLDKDLRDTLEEDIRTVAGNYLSPRGYTILTGDNTLELMADNAVDASKVCDATCALKAAREMKANLFISGSATKAEGEYIAFVRLFEAKGGRQLGSVKLEGAKVKELREQFETKAAELFQRVEGLAGTGEVAVATTTTTAPPEVAPSGPRVKKSQVTAAVGTLTISAKPKDVVRVDLVDPDGKKSATGASYENKQAKPGTWRLVARASGYEEQEQTVEVPPDDVTLVKIELKPFGGLKVTGTPSGAAVSVSGPGGFHDDGGLPWEADGLKSGTYQVKVTRAGYGAAEETAEVKPGETATVRVALQKSMVSAGGGGGATKVEPKSGLTFIHLPGGTFHYGCEPQDTQCFDTEKPGKSVTGQPMWMGKTTVTVAAYAKCVSAGACTAANTGGVCNWQVRGKENHPINCIDWNQATAFCQWIGGRLPTAEEWEYAAKGGESRIYPWGNEAPDDNRALFGKPYPGDGTAPADSYGGGASKHGLLNMAGNVWQWTESNYGAGTKELRGGSWNYDPQFLRASYRDRYPPSLGYGDIGVRCGL